MIELSEPQRDALAQEPNKPLEVVDPATQRTFVLIDADQFQRLVQTIVPGALSTEERRVVLAGIWRRAGWDDPAMDAYDQLETAGPL